MRRSTTDVVNAGFAILEESQKSLGNVRSVKDVAHLLARSVNHERPSQNASNREIGNPTVVFAPELTWAVEPGESIAGSSHTVSVGIDAHVILG